MSGTVKKEVLRKRRALAVLVTGVLVLASSGPTLAVGMIGEARGAASSIVKGSTRGTGTAGQNVFGR